SPDFFRSSEIVAGTGCIVGADIVGLPLEIHAERQRAGARELAGKCPTRRYSTKHQTGIDCGPARPSENLIGQLLVQMTEIGMGKFMPEHEGKLRIGTSDPQDA